MSVPSGPLRITMIGHSTVLIEMGGIRILTDPFFGRHGNPAYRRIAPPAASREEMAGADLVLLSHDHWDHFDRRYFQMLPASVPVVVPAAARGWMRLRGVRRAVGVRSWDSLQHRGITVWGVPAHHMAVSCGFVIEHGRQRVYFAGDTFAGEFHKKIARELAPAVALLPVTTFRLPMTMGEDEAVRAVRDLQSQVVIPIHLGLEPRSPLLRTSQSVERFRAKLRAVAPEAQVVHLRDGENWESDQEETVPETVARYPAGAASTRPVTPPGSRRRDRRLAPLVVRRNGRREEVDGQNTVPQDFLMDAGPTERAASRDTASPAA
jgi:L-ascorbate metabolism protein UlaG (beta-lactamase superfamily)